MIFSSVISTVAILAATASAAPLQSRDATPVMVAIKAINAPSVSGSTPDIEPYQTVEIPLGKLTTVDKVDITSLSFSEVSENEFVDVSNVICQRYKDEYGTQVGGPVFSSVHPAEVSTNSVSLGWILCYINTN